MPKHDRSWHEHDLADELAEYHDEAKLLKKWSELSDVVYTCSRGRWSGHDIAFPFSHGLYAIGVLYMLPKYTGRWLFFRRAGERAGSAKVIREVRNPNKVAKLHDIAKMYEVDPEMFEGICKRQLRYWPLLP